MKYVSYPRPRELAKSFQGRFVYRDVADPTVLRVFDGYRPALQVHLLPLKVQQLASPHAGVDGHDDQRFEVRSGRFDKPALLIRSEDTHELLFDTVERHSLERVSFDKVPVDRKVE